MLAWIAGTVVALFMSSWLGLLFCQSLFKDMMAKVFAAVRLSVEAIVEETVSRYAWQSTVDFGVKAISTGLIQLVPSHWQSLASLSLTSWRLWPLQAAPFPHESSIIQSLEGILSS